MAAEVGAKSALSTRSGIPLSPWYSPADASRADASPERPGEFPFTRGRLRPGRAPGGATWIQRELSGEGGPERSNQQLQYLLAHGQTGVDVIGDTVTSKLLDPTHPLAGPAIGTTGVNLCSRRDYLALFAGIDLEKISVSMSLPPCFALAGLYLAARASGADLGKVRGSLIQGPLYVEDCSYAIRYPAAFRTRMSVDSIAWASAHLPRLHGYIEDTYFFSESGLNGVEEMALGFVQMRHLVRQLRARGLAIDTFAPRIGFLVNCSMDLFEEIAKIRATRRIYARMMRDEYGAADPRSLSCVITSHTSGLSLTAQQPVNNIVRGAVQALALGLAGVQAAEISAFDEAFRTPSAEAHLVGLRSQQIIDLETGVMSVQDPLGGSYYVEALTDEIEKRIVALVREIEARGDPDALSDQGFFREIFQNAMRRDQADLFSGRRKVVGVNVHCIEPAQDTLLRDLAETKIAPYRERIEEVRQLKESRARAPWADALRGVYAATASSQPLMPAVVAAYEADATLEEVHGAMRLALGLSYDGYGIERAPLELA